MYHRSRSPLLVLPQDQLRLAEMENRLSKLECDVRTLSTDQRDWKAWEAYLYQVWFWARDVAAALAKFPWLWNPRRVSSGSANCTGLEEP